MLLTITTTHRPATDLGHLLHEHPERMQSFSLPFGRAHVFYPEASEERCSAALMLEVDAVGLIRRGVRFPRLDQYVNDRAYVASSFLSVAISRVYGTALGGSSRERPQLVEQPLPLRARIAACPARAVKACSSFSRACAPSSARYRQVGVPKVICQEKHMGSRAVVVICRDDDIARRRFASSTRALAPATRVPAAVSSTTTGSSTSCSAASATPPNAASSSSGWAATGSCSTAS